MECLYKKEEICVCGRVCVGEYLITMCVGSIIKFIEVNLRMKICIANVVLRKKASNLVVVITF